MAEDQIDVGVRHDVVGDDRAGIAGFPLHRRNGDDRDLRKRLHLLLESLLDIERVGVARVAEHLQDLSLHRAVLGGQQLLSLLGGDVADLDRAGDGGEGRFGRGDLAVELDDRDACRHCRLDRGFQRVEIDGGQDDRRGLERDDVVHLALLRVRLVVGIERLHLVADLFEEHFERTDRAGLELVEQCRHEVVHGSLRLREGRRQHGNRQCQDAEGG